MFNIGNAPDYGGLLNGLLDADYPQLVAPVVQAIGDDLERGGVLGLAINSLVLEAERLEAEGLKLTAANPVYRAFVQDVRHETLDARTCLACIALHGTKYPPGTSLDAHPNGRGVMVAVAKGFAMPQQWRVVDGQTISANTGREWWGALPPDAQFGVGRNSAAVRALQAGAIDLGDMVGRKRINLFGVSGAASDRRALVRVPSAKFIKLQVGDRLDGGRVAQIGPDSLVYQKGGRNLALSMPNT